MRLLVYLLVFVLYFDNLKSLPVQNNPVDPRVQITVNTKNLTGNTNTISYKIIDKPHHLFIGRCKPEDELIHQEKIIVYNDGKSHVAASIRVEVMDPVYITCVKIIDEVPDGKGGYPTYSAGGVAHNFVEFKVDTEYGNGFNFFVQLFGTSSKEKGNDV